MARDGRYAGHIDRLRAFAAEISAAREEREGRLPERRLEPNLDPLVQPGYQAPATNVGHRH